MVAEHAGIDRVHPLKLRHVGQKHAASEHVLQARPGRFENRRDVLQDLLGLRLDVRTCHRARDGVGRPLPRHEHEALEDLRG